MRFEPETWTARQYLGRAESGRTRPLRLSCSHHAEDGTGARAEFFAKFVGLPEITGQSLFAEMLGNVLARSCGIATGEPAFIEIDQAFSKFLRDVDIRVPAGLEASEAWMPAVWTEWYARVRDHLWALMEHEHDVVYEVAGSLS